MENNTMMHREILDLWRTRVQAAEDIGVKPNLIAQWYVRNSISASHWLAVVRAARKRRFPGVTLQSLAESYPHTVN